MASFLTVEESITRVQFSKWSYFMNSLSRSVIPTSIQTQPPHQKESQVEKSKIYKLHKKIPLLDLCKSDIYRTRIFSFLEQIDRDQLRIWYSQCIHSGENRQKPPLLLRYQGLHVIEKIQDQPVLKKEIHLTLKKEMLSPLKKEISPPLKKEISPPLQVKAEEHLSLQAPPPLIHQNAVLKENFLRSLSKLTSFSHQAVAEGIKQFKQQNYEKADQIFTKYINHFNIYYSIKNKNSIPPIPDHVLLYAARTQLKVGDYLKANDFLRQLTRETLSSDDLECEVFADLARIKSHVKNKEASLFFYKKAFKKIKGNKNEKVDQETSNKIVLKHVRLMLDSDIEIAHSMLTFLVNQNQPIEYASPQFVYHLAFYSVLCNDVTLQQNLFTTIVDRFVREEKIKPLFILRKELDEMEKIFNEEIQHFFPNSQVPELFLCFMIEINTISKRISQ